MKNKRMLSIIITALLILICVIYNWIIKDMEAMEAMVNTDISSISELFPSLKGVKSTEWEQIKRGDTVLGFLGPSDYTYQGYIFLSDEAAENYLHSYSWTSSNPDVSLKHITQKKGNWKYSFSFAKDYIPGYYNGDIWLDGNIILFSITTT